MTALAGYSVGTAYLQILPSLRGLASSVTSQLNSQLRGVGDRAGSEVGRQLGGGVSTGLLPALRKVETAFTDTAKAGAGSMTTLARGTAPVLDQLAKVSPVLGRVRDGFGSAQIAALELSGTSGTLGGRLRAVTDTTSRLGSGFTAMAKVSDSALSRLGSTVQDAVTAPLRGASTILAGYGITAGTIFTGAGVAAVGMGVRFAASQEQATVAFTTMLHSAQAAQQFMAQLQTFAAQTPFDVPSVVTGAQRLMAFGFTAQQVLPTLTAIGDAVSGLGGGAEQIDQVVLAIGQMQAKTRVQSDEILQLTEAGIPALRILANEYHTTTAAMQDMITRGVVPSSEAIPKLLQGIEQGTRGAAGETQAFAGMMANQATTLTGIWSNFQDNVNRALGQLVTPALPAIKSGLAVLTTGLGGLPALIARFETAARPIAAQVTPVFRDIGAFITSSLIPALRNLWIAVQPLAVILGGSLLVALRAAGSVLRDVLGPALVAVSSWLRPLMPVVVGVAAAFAGWLAIATTVRLIVTVFTLLRTAVMAVTIAWRILSLAFTVSPIGLILTLVAALVAGVIYAWTHFQGFRDVVMACWRGIQSAASFAWNSVLRPTLAALGTAARAVGAAFATGWSAVLVAVHAVGAAATWLWSTVLSPVFKAIYTAAAILFGIVVTAVLTPIWLAMKLVGTIAVWLWNVALHPVFSAIGTAAVWLWNVAIKPTIDLIVGYLQLWAAVGIWLWHNAIQPALNGIGALFGWLWTQGIKPALDLTVAAIRAVGSAAVWLWQQVIVPAWQGIGAFLSGANTNVIQPVFSAVRAGLSAVGSAFAWVYANVIRPAWSAMGTAVRAVYDAVLHPAFEAIKTAVGAVGSAFAAASNAIRIAWDAVKGWAATPINWVIDHVWNHGIRDVWNAITGWIPGVNLTLGMVKPIALAPGGVLPGYAPGRDSVHALLSPGEAVLVPELVRLLGADTIVAANAAARAGRGGTAAGPSLAADGTPAFFLGGLWSGISSLAAGIGHVADDVVGAIGDAATFIARFTTDPLGTITGMIPALSGLTQWTAQGWGKAIAQLPGAAIGGLISAIKKSLGLADDGRGGPPPAPAASAGVAQWTGLVQQALAMLGQPLSLVPNVLRRMNQESGGNPRAINLTDINAQRGTPSIGLMQVIQPTFTRWRSPSLSADIYDPLANIYAGLDYAVHQYPSLQYAMDKPGGYDSGGWLPPGLSTVYNGTSRPEAVFTAGQFNTLTRAATTSGGQFTGTLTLDSGEFLGVVRGQIDQANGEIATALLQRTR